MQVRLVNRSLRLVAVVSMAAAAVTGIVASSASASTTAPSRAAAHAATAHAAAAPAMTPRRAPSGCNNYNLCEYNAGNGGNLCFQTRNSENWPSACADHNEGEYNRGSRAVYLYSQTGETGCYYLLYSGHYLLYNANDKFQGPNQACRNEKLEHHLASSKFVS